MIKNTLLSILFVSLVFIGCDKDGGENKVNFDRTAMLQGMAENHIVPAYRSLNSAVNDLKNSFTEFETNLDQQSLTDLKADFLVVYRYWQACAMFEFGPAMDVALRSNLNTFPTDTTGIKNNITSGTYNLNTAANIDAKGLPAIDYLLFASDDASTLTAFQDQNSMDYLGALITDITTKVTQVHNTWNNDYTSTFVAADGVDVGSSLSEVLNQMNYQLELIKNAKIGIPLGKRSLDQALPDKVEAYYSGISSELAALNLDAIQRLYKGEMPNGNYNSFHAYLQAIDAQYNGGSLASAIESQLSITATAIDGLPATLSDAVVNNTTPINAAYVEVQKTVVLLKSDMPSALGVLITYQDNDGD